jgi:hypothetical protein
MPSTYTPIGFANISTTTSAVTFSSIPQTYTDLVIVVSTYSANGGSFSNIQTKYNGDTTNSNYAYGLMYSQGSGSSSGGGNAGWWGYISGNAGAYSTMQAHIMSYSSTNRFKTTIITESNGVVNNPLYAFELSVMTWKNTSAVTSLIVDGSNGGFAVGSKLTLYGIKAA